MANIGLTYDMSKLKDSLAAAKGTLTLVLYTELQDLLYLTINTDAPYFYSGMTEPEYRDTLMQWYSGKTEVLLIHAAKYGLFESPLGDGTEPVKLWFSPDVESALFKEIYRD